MLVGLHSSAKFCLQVLFNLASCFESQKLLSILIKAFGQLGHPTKLGLQILALESFLRCKNFLGRVGKGDYPQNTENSQNPHSE